MSGIGSTLPRAGKRPRLKGVLITVAFIGLIEILNRFILNRFEYRVPTPVGIGTLGVVYSAFVGGTLAGMASAGLLVLYGAYCFSIPGTPFQFDQIGLWRLAVAMVVPPTIVLVIGTLKGRSDRANEVLRRQAVLEAQIAERAQSHHALLQTRDEQQTIFHSVPAMIWFKDKEGRILRANRNAAQSIGRTVEEVDGKSTYELYPDEAAKYQRDDTEVIESGRPKLGIVERYSIPGGEERWVRTDKIPYYDASGTIVGVVVFAVDISEQKRAQEALQRAHDELDRRVQMRTAELTLANERLRQEIAEREQAERVITERTLLAQFAADVGVALTCGKDLRGMLKECCEAMVRHLDAAFARIWVLDGTGQTLQLESSAGLYTHIDGVHARIPVGKLKVGLIAQERRPHLTNNVMGDSRIGDPDWAKREGMVAFAGYPLMIGERVIGVMALFSRKPLSLHVTQAMAAVADTLALGIERQQASLVLEQHARALEEANGALEKAEEAAQAASHAKSRFLANISHEIRTPIMAMLGAAELLPSDESGRLDHPDRGDMILRNGRHLLSLVDELLDLSRLEAGKLEIRPHNCSFVEILADVDAITEPLRRRKKVDYRIVYETQLPEHIHTDCTRLTQAVSNLVSNALKFTQEGFVRLRVRVERDAPEPRLTIVVEDSGIGIRPEDLERIFDSFTQVGPNSSGVTAGIGLGLPIAKWVAEKLGGTLEVQSAFGKGSTFTLRIATGPLEGVSWITPSWQPGRSSPGAPGLLKARRKAPHRLLGRVLLAEDARDIRDLIAFTLRRCGVEVTTVENGRQAIEAAIRDTFDLILMDIRMPELDGLSAAVELRQRGCRSTLIALTASTSDRQREQILTAGFDDFWAKPISLDDLAERVASYLPSPIGPVEDQVAARDHDRGATSNERMNAIVAEFVTSLPMRAGAIRAAIEGGDLPLARDLLHQLVGTSGIQGFMSISQEAARLLQILKNPTIAMGPVELRSLEDMIAGLRPSFAHNADATAVQAQDS